MPASDRIPTEMVSTNRIHGLLAARKFTTTKFMPLSFTLMEGKIIFPRTTSARTQSATLKWNKLSFQEKRVPALNLKHYQKELVTEKL
jgi:hypothetical protein